MDNGEDTDFGQLSSTISESAWSRRVFQSTIAALPDIKVTSFGREIY
jgi:hypothetical protein